MKVICKSVNGSKLICIKSSKGKIFSKQKFTNRIDWNELLKNKCYEVWKHTGNNPEMIMFNNAAFNEFKNEKISEVSLRSNKSGFLSYESIPVHVQLS